MVKHLQNVHGKEGAVKEYLAKLQQAEQAGKQIREELGINMKTFQDHA